MFPGEVCRFAWIALQVHQKRRVEPDAVGRRDVPVDTERRCAGRLCRAHKVQFPPALTDGLQVLRYNASKAYIAHLDYVSCANE